MKFTDLTKRVLSLTAAALMTAALATSVSAAPGKQNLGTVAKVEASAVKVDGKKEAIYDKGLKTKTAVNSKNEAITADAWVLWTDDYVYFYAEVKDATLTDISAAEKKTSPWNADSIEAFIDDDNDGKNYGMQYRVDFTGYGTWKDRNANKNYYTVDVLGTDFQYAAVKSSTGYTAEMRLPLKGAKVGQQIGFNIQVNGISSTSYLVSDGWNTPEYPYFVLGDLVKEEKPAAAATTTAAAPKTADMTSVLALASVLMSGAAVVGLKRKK